MRRTGIAIALLLASCSAQREEGEQHTECAQACATLERCGLTPLGYYNCAQRCPLSSESVRGPLVTCTTERQGGQCSTTFDGSPACAEIADCLADWNGENFLRPVQVTLRPQPLDTEEVPLCIFAECPYRGPTECGGPPEPISEEDPTGADGESDLPQALCGAPPCSSSLEASTQYCDALGIEEVWFTYRARRALSGPPITTATMSCEAALVEGASLELTRGSWSITVSARGRLPPPNRLSASTNFCLTLGTQRFAVEHDGALLRLPLASMDRVTAEDPTLEPCQPHADAP